MDVGLGLWGGLEGGRGRTEPAHGCNTAGVIRTGVVARRLAAEIIFCVCWRSRSELIKASVGVAVADRGFIFLLLWQ